jgi:hypothetical protein
MKTKFCLIAMTFILFTLTNCNNSNNQKEKELELKEKELSLRERELGLKAIEKTKQNETPKSGSISQNVAGPNELSNIENLIGYWFTPHGATVNIRFNRNGRFEFNDYNSSSEKEELLTGEFILQNGTITLMYDDRPKQNFKFYKGESGDDNYYIKKNGYYFVKGENAN